MHPEAAVVIPCYNHGEYVQEAVQSALHQNIGVELIVIDDGSTDTNTLSVLDKLRLAGVSVHRQSNRGLPEARNTGIKLTSSEFIVCLDADDMLQPAYCSTCLEVMKARPEVGFVYSTTQVFGTENRLWSRAAYSGLHLLIDNYIPYAAMFRRKLWDEVGGFSEDMKNKYEDWDFWLGALERGWKGCHVPQELFWYRKHGQSMLSSSNLQRRELKRLLRRRHSRLYSFRKVAEMMVEERFPLLRLIGAVLKENTGRAVANSMRYQGSAGAKRT